MAGAAALVLSADHELNASTFAARVAASTGADLQACLLAALATFLGPRHGGAARAVEALLDEVARPGRAEAVIRARTSRGGKISNAISRVENARDQIGANVTFRLGQGNLFF